METDHIIPRDEEGKDEIDNAIPVCFECHAEIHGYNDKHPRGRKFQAEELRLHKEQWLRICREKPEVFVAASWEVDVGPLQALIDELEFNARVAEILEENARGCLFRDAQFQRAIQSGSIAVLRDEVKKVLLDAYVAIGAANQRISWAWRQDVAGLRWKLALDEAISRIRDAKPLVEKARDELLKFLVSEAG